MRKKKKLQKKLKEDNDEEAVKELEKERKLIQADLNYIDVWLTYYPRSFLQ